MSKALIVYRGQHCFVILNAYPYTPGHVMIVPYAHLDELQKLPPEAAQRNDGSSRSAWSACCANSTIPTASTWA